MFYSIRHLTKFRYSTPVSESMMELRMNPRSEGLQRCLNFQVTVTPRTRVQSYRDYMGNVRDPPELVAGVNTQVYKAIAYVPKSTRVDSPVDDAPRNRQGVCQDYSHIMIALLRRMGIPCRYVSGYLFHKAGVPPT